MAHKFETPPLKGEGRLTNTLLKEKMRHGRGPLFGSKKTKHGVPVRGIHHGLR